MHRVGLTVGARHSYSNYGADDVSFDITVVNNTATPVTAFQSSFDLSVTDVLGNVYADTVTWTDKDGIPAHGTMTYANRSDQSDAAHSAWEAGPEAVWDAQVQAGTTPRRCRRPTLPLSNEV